MTPKSSDTIKIVSYYKKKTFLKSVIITAFVSILYIFTFISTAYINAQDDSNTTVSNIDILFEKADTLYNQQKYEEAIQYYDKILAINSSDIDALNSKGVALSDIQKYDEAIENFDKILAITSSDVAINNKAQVLAESGKNDEALSIIQSVVAVNPTDEYILGTMAFILANLGREEESRMYYEEALYINSNFTKILTEKELDAFNKVMGN
ncbi:MAG: hypothetical protein DA328_01460 [Nitrososphaeraceae archaeon]|nr:hypothetical protein [Nitrososphaeraceae archaeon]